MRILWDKKCVQCPATDFAVGSSSGEPTQSNGDALPGTHHSTFHLCSDKPMFEGLHKLL